MSNFVSSKDLSGELGIKHSKLKELFLKHNIHAVAAGLDFVDDGTTKRQRIVLVDRSNVDNMFSNSSKSLRRPKKKKKQK